MRCADSFTGAVHWSFAGRTTGTIQLTFLRIRRSANVRSRRKRGIAVRLSVHTGDSLLPAKLKSYLPAICCALIPILGYLLVRPWAELGNSDDWLYIKDAQNLALTGHIIYSGAETPMLGWQLYLGALLIKLFGFSFSVVRFSTVIEAMATAFLLQRTLLRAGINSRNATLATLTFVVSPLYLPYVYTYMTDVSGLLCIVLCLYMCLRALQAASEGAAMAWIASAAISNAVGGTARQIVWFGLFLMIPSTLWLLRRNRRVLLTGGICCLAGIAFAVAAQLWFAHRPPIVGDSQVLGAIDSVKNLGRVTLGGAGVMTLFSLPVLLMFAGSLRLKTRLWAAIAAILAVAPMHFLKIDKWPSRAVYNPNTYDSFERLNTIVGRGIHLAAAQYSLRFALIAAGVFGILCLWAVALRGGHARSEPGREASEISWQKLAIILAPFSIAYFLLVAVRLAFFDRYFLPLFAFLLLALTLYYQQKANKSLPWASVPLIFLFGVFSLAAVHDEYALFRADVAAADEIRSSGAPATSIIGPQEYEGWAELGIEGQMKPPPREIRSAELTRLEQTLPANCDKNLFTLILVGVVPDVRPDYAVTLNPGECGGQVAFPPIPYRTWIAPRENSVYAVRLPASVSTFSASN